MLVGSRAEYKLCSVSGVFTVNLVDNLIDSVFSSIL